MNKQHKQTGHKKTLACELHEPIVPQKKTDILTLVLLDDAPKPRFLDSEKTTPDSLHRVTSGNLGEMFGHAWATWGSPKSQQI